MRKKLFIVSALFILISSTIEYLNHSDSSFIYGMYFILNICGWGGLLVSLLNNFEDTPTYKSNSSTEREGFSWRDLITGILVFLLLVGNLFVISLYKSKKKEMLLNSGEVQITQAVVSKLYTQKRSKYQVLEYVRLNYKTGQKNVSCSLQYSHKNIRQGQKVKIKYPVKYTDICQILSVTD